MNKHIFGDCIFGSASCLLVKGLIPGSVSGLFLLGRGARLTSSHQTRRLVDLVIPSDRDVS